MPFGPGTYPPGDPRNFVGGRGGGPGRVPRPGVPPSRDPMEQPFPYTGQFPASMPTPAPTRLADIGLSFGAQTAPLLPPAAAAPAVQADAGFVGPTSADKVPPMPPFASPAHRLTILNGPNLGVFDYTKGAGGGYTGRQVTDAADPMIAQARDYGYQVEGAGGNPALGFGPLPPAMLDNMGRRAAGGLPVNANPLGAGTSLDRLREFSAGLGLGPEEAGGIFAATERNKLLEDQIAGADKREYQRIYSDAVKRLAAEPLPSGRIRTPVEVQAEAQREADSWREAYQRGGQAFGGGPTATPAPGGGPAPTTPAPAGSVDARRQQMSRLGPAADWLNSGISTEEFWKNVLAHDRSSPGFMQTVGPELMQEFNRVRGEQSLKNFLTPGIFSGFGSMFREGLGFQTEADKAREALRYYLGLVRRPFGQPSTGGGPVHPDVLKNYPGLSQ